MASAGLILLAACTQDEVPGGGGGEGPGGSGGQEPPWSCPPGSLEQPGGTCLPAGVPEDGCAPGFEPDGDLGCAPVLPAEDCPAGTYAVPGDTECRAVAPCGSAPWGEIQTGPNTQYVDAAYAGGDSDGNESKPWTTIQEGVAAAEPGAVVAVGAGTYIGMVVIQKEVQLWGRCPELVEVRGDPELPFALLVAGGTHGVVVRGLSVTGPNSMVGATDATGAVFEQLWLHDKPNAGFTVSEEMGPVEATLRDSLIEAVGYNGVGLIGGQTLLERVVIRDTTISDGDGYGVTLQPGDLTPGHVTIRSTIIEGSENSGAVVVNGAAMTIEGSVIRDAQPPAGSDWGMGAIAQSDPQESGRSTLTVSGSLVEDNYSVGIFIAGSDLVMDRTVVRGTAARPSDQGLGRGVSVQPYQTGEGSALAIISSSLIEDNLELGLGIMHAEGTIEATAVRRTAPREVDGQAGMGVAIEYDPWHHPQAGAQATINGCLITDNHVVGLMVIGASADVVQTVIQHTASQPQDGSFGDGLAVLSGIIPSSTELVPAAATVSQSRIATNARAGIANFAAALSIGQSELSCNTVHLNGEGVDDTTYAFTDLGAVTCGCEDEWVACKVLSTGLTPPTVAGTD